MRKNYSDCKYCGSNVPFARVRLGYDYCINDICVSRGLKGLPVVESSGYLPGRGLTPRKFRVQVSQLVEV